IAVPDLLRKWLYREPSARGARNGPRKGQGRPAKRVFVENLTAASVRKCTLCRQNATRGADLDRVVRTNSTVSSESDQKQLPGKLSPSSTSCSRSTNSGTFKSARSPGELALFALRRRHDSWKAPAEAKKKSRLPLLKAGRRVAQRPPQLCSPEYDVGGGGSNTRGILRRRLGRHAAAGSVVHKDQRSSPGASCVASVLGRARASHSRASPEGERPRPPEGRMEEREDETSPHTTRWDGRGRPEEATRPGRDLLVRPAERERARRASGPVRRMQGCDEDGWRE
ncbi:hypothetical protein THAOC_00602, partial [Thalassiosira oceanica]